jgi:FKBP-type peptidyl-prolyl cis-trans isomerase
MSHADPYLKDFSDFFGYRQREDKDLITMKKPLIIVLGLVFLSGCAASTQNVDTQATPAPATKEIATNTMEPATAAPAPEVAKKETAAETNEPAAAYVPTPGVLKLAPTGNHRAFMADNLKKEGVKKLGRDIQYRVIKAGQGSSPALEDTVDIKFRATRTDGTLYATSDSGDNTPRSYQVRKTMPALQQALLKMNPGSKWEVFVAPNNRNELTAKGGVLIYELELVAVHPAAG